MHLKEVTPLCCFLRLLKRTYRIKYANWKLLGEIGDGIYELILVIMEQDNLATIFEF